MTEVRYTKWDGRLHWHFDLADLGEDRHGLWLCATRGQRVRRGDEPPLTEPHGFVCLVPPNDSWIAYFSLGGEQEVYIDVTTKPRRYRNRVEAVDLDLDVIRWRDGRVTLEDEDEFVAHQQRFGYPIDVISDAEATANRLVTVVSARFEPFGDAATRWIELCSTSDSSAGGWDPSGSRPSTRSSRRRVRPG